MSKKNVKMNEKNCIWKDEEYLMFIDAIDPNIEECLLFELLYIGGLRVGEALALTPMDFNFKENTLSINKSLTYINDKAVSTSTKQLNDNRTIRLPNKLLNEMENFINNNQIKNTNNVFSTSRYKLSRILDDKCKKINLPQITFHF
jgi:integrase